MSDTLTLRPATKADAPALARLVDIAGEGIPRIVWAGMAEAGETIWDVGARRAAREEGAFSYRNATIVDVDGAPAASLVGYSLSPFPEPVDLAGLPPMFRPLQELENRAPGTWYINILATFAEHRNRGLGARLIAEARSLARAAGCIQLSLIMQDANPAERLYLREGFHPACRRPIVTEGDWRSPGKNWVLMIANV
ncbi:MAG: GNAT family N-acetyltransferase [Pseudomonadota bacterium]